MFLVLPAFHEEEKFSYQITPVYYV